MYQIEAYNAECRTIVPVPQLCPFSFSDHFGQQTTVCGPQLHNPQTSVPAVSDVTKY